MNLQVIKLLLAGSAFLDFALSCFWKIAEMHSYFTSENPIRTDYDLIYFGLAVIQFGFYGVIQAIGEKR